MVTSGTSSQPCFNANVTTHSQCAVHNEAMALSSSPLRTRVIAYWNWKCALMSATARSLVYLAALARSGPHGRLSIVLVEIAYVALTAGVYAGLQQRALAIRSRLAGNLIIAFGVPSLAQFVDWLAHRVAGAPVPFRATVAVSVFACLSALFHLYVMRRGVFLSGQGRSLGDDFRRIPRLVVGFVIAPVTLITSLAGRSESAAESEAVL
jgi:hypothetical protein